MKVFVLAAGQGTRLQSFFSGPKILVPVFGKPLLVRQVEFLTQFTSVGDVTFILSWMADEVTAFIRRERLGCGYAVVPFSDTANELRVAIESVDRDEPIVVLNGDTLIDIDLAAFVEDFRASSAAASVGLVPLDDAAAYGTATFEGRTISSFQEKTGIRGPGLVNAGVYVLTPGLLFRFPSAASLESDLFPKLAKSGELRGFVHSGFMFDCGTPDRILAAERFLGNGRGDSQKNG